MAENSGSMRWTDSTSMFEWTECPSLCTVSPAVCTITHFANDSKVGGVIESLQTRCLAEGSR